MPLLRDVLPELVTDGSLSNSEVYRLRDRAVTAVKLATGAPCSSKGELFAPWPGESGDVGRWFVLDNGMAVGCETGSGGESIRLVVAKMDAAS